MWLIPFLHLLYFFSLFFFFFFLATVGLNYALSKKICEDKTQHTTTIQNPSGASTKHKPNIRWKSLFCCEKRGNTTWRHRLASVVYLWPSVLLCVLLSNNHLSNAIMYRNSRYLLGLKSYPLWHAETAWGNISCWSSCGSGGELLYLSLPAEHFNCQKTVKKETLLQTWSKSLTKQWDRRNHKKVALPFKWTSPLLRHTYTMQ